ncbi:RidA family protein [Tropicimonas marinistellae]|uniref:RidA family protein n=1 Tax=Tropicimonas marinistellae TaxID=1739787 RepID=UPI000830EAB6|nr:RidA family protein [Tropicimonas marinistellae]
MTPGDAAVLARAGVVLPPAQPPVGTFVAVVETGGLLHVSGQAPLDPAGIPLRGRVGDEVDTGEARARARRTGLALLAAVASEPGRLSRVTRVVRLLGMVNAVSDFTEISEVLDGCSELFTGIFPGGHARTDVGLPALPSNITVEIEAVFAIAPKASDPQ